MLESLFNEVKGLRPATLLKRDSNTGASCQYCEIFKNTYFEEHLRMTASGKNAVNKILSNSFLNIQIQQIS